ncbi:MAG: RusA family crossover junction endodeoxyribonuclease, partial [Oscillospiraceae bacterium]
MVFTETTEFFLPMIPPTVTAQEHKVMIRKGKPVFYDPPAVKDAREKLLAHLAKHVPPQPYDRKPLELTVQWCFPIAHRAPRRAAVGGNVADIVSAPLKGSHKDGEYRITKPDTDNLQKLLKDCMTQL